MKKIKDNISSDIFYLHDDFGEKCLSRPKLEEMYVTVIIQKGRRANNRRFENRDEMYKIHLTPPANATTLSRTADLFEPRDVGNKHPKTILVVGRPGICKTLLTKKIFYQWQE